MIILGIETSCDETAVGIVTDSRTILVDLVYSQLVEHQAYGGVVPEIAARSHLDRLDGMVEQALSQSGLALGDLDGIAATIGPGLIGGLLVGASFGKALALAAGLPFIAVNHLAAHALTVRLTDDLPFPFLLLLVSGGHCQLLVVAGVQVYHRLGTSLDDAIGESFDKTAKLIGLGYPGGPAVEQAAAGWHAAPDAPMPNFPRPMLGRAGCDFSFAGLKTAVRREVERKTAQGNPLSVANQHAIAAGFQAAVKDVIVDRCRVAAKQFRAEYPQACHLVIAGGVAANQTLRTALAELENEIGLTLLAPPQHLCTDNGVMVAWAGLEQLRCEQRGDAMAIAPRPRWPLDPQAPPRPFAGVKA